MNKDNNASAPRGLSNGKIRTKDVGKSFADEAEAWKVAQLAAQLTAGSVGANRGIAPENCVRLALSLLAEARRAVATPEPPR